MTREHRRFAHIAAAGITFQGGSAAVDSSTIIASLVYQLTGSAVAVGAVTAILRIGWLAPQLLVGFLVQRAGSSLRYFVIGAFGRATCLAALATLLASSEGLSPTALVIGFFVLWTAYAFVSGIVAVPYIDMVARSVPSERRSRLLALRFFGGGVLAITIAVGADHLLGALVFPFSYAAIIGAAAGLMYLSSILFVIPGEPETPSDRQQSHGFWAYILEGLAVFRENHQFRHFVFAQWSGATVLMAMPFYVVAASDELSFDLGLIAYLLGAQTAGALLANPLWGWWGDRFGKRSLLRGVAILRTVPPLGMLLLIAIASDQQSISITACMALFFVLGSLMSGVTIAVLGYLMEISPEENRPAYSGYFNSMTAPAYLLPVFAGVLVDAMGSAIVLAIAALGGFVQFGILCRLGRAD